jgi:hypothetical protein
MGIILDSVGAPTVVVFVNNAGVLLFNLPLAAIVHVSAGKKEEVHADNH